jgi:hypothetical protein
MMMMTMTKAQHAAARQKQAHACLAAFNFVRHNYPDDAERVYKRLPPVLKDRLDKAFPDEESGTNGVPDSEATGETG